MPWLAPSLRSGCARCRFLNPSPVVILNRAVALSMLEGPHSGIKQLHAIQQQVPMKEYFLFHATLADFCRRAGLTREARDAYQRAVQFAGSDAERRFLLGKLETPGINPFYRPGGFRKNRRSQSAATGWIQPHFEVVRGEPCSVPAAVKLQYFQSISSVPTGRFPWRRVSREPEHRT